MRRCRLCAAPALILPVAVREKRFLAPLLVFILGILSSRLKDLPEKAARHARQASRPIEARVIPGRGWNGKGGGARRVRAGAGDLTSPRRREAGERKGPTAQRWEGGACRMHPPHRSLTLAPL